MRMPEYTQNDAPSDEHVLGRDWKLPRGIAMETACCSIADTIAHLTDLVAMLEYDKKTELARDINSLIGRLRSEQSDYASAAKKLQT